jgi:hypothetical protein
VRWLEWGARSYHSLTLGLALAALGAVVVLSARVPRAFGILMMLSGAAYLTQAWVLASHGFSDDDSTAILVGYVFTTIWAVGLTVFAWKRPTPSGGKSLRAAASNPAI